MFIPCDHCLRKHATHVSEVNDRGEPEHLRLCAACYQRLKQDLAHRPPEDLKEVERKMLDHELRIAEGLQANLLPRAVPQIPGFDVSAFYRPSRDVGGDYYDFLEIDGDHVGILVADVSGKGVPGTIVMTETRALVKSESARSSSPAETLARVNRVLHKDIKRGMFVTLFYAMLHRAKATLTCVSAGHNPMLLWRPKSRSHDLINPNGLALGIDRGPLFERTIVEERIQLAVGDRFTIYTDGVVEAMNSQNQSFGDDRLRHTARNASNLSSAEFLEQLMREIDRHHGDAPQHDDITIVTCRYKSDV